jgi:1-acyl-sn-glycerol-3-phosphate acyltransferase
MIPSKAVQKSQRLDRRLTHHLLAWVLRLFFRIYGRWRVIGTENIPRTGPVLFATNHASYLDPPLGWAATYGHRRMWGMARDDLWKHPVLAYLLDSIGAIPLSRRSADRAALRQAIEILKAGETIGIFPEGTRTPDGKLLPAQPGIALLVQRTGTPVVPVAMLGTYEMLPRNQKRLKRARLTIIYGEPIHFAADASREEITTKTMEAIAALMTAHGCPMEPPSPERAALVEEVDGSQ